MALACLPLMSAAVPLVQGTQVYTDNVGVNPVVPSGWMLGLGALNVVPSGSGTTVQALHVPADPTQDYAIPRMPLVLYPNAYLAVMPYEGQSGSWSIQATDATGTGSASTHVLDDIRRLPLVQDVTIHGVALAPTVQWSAMDPALYPSYCSYPCPIGFDFFNYAVVVRDGVGDLLFQSPAIPNVGAATLMWALPEGLLTPGAEYLIGVRLNMSELERINADGSFYSPLENRSSAYVGYAVPVPELPSLALALAGLALLGGLGRWRREP